VNGLFTIKDLPAYKSHLRDYLVRLKEFASDDNTDLYAEENEAILQAKYVFILQFDRNT
jgi:exportin-1